MKSNLFVLVAFLLQSTSIQPSFASQSRDCFLAKKQSRGKPPSPVPGVVGKLLIGRDEIQFLDQNRGTTTLFSISSEREMNHNNRGKSYHWFEYRSSGKVHGTLTTTTSLGFEDCTIEWWNENGDWLAQEHYSCPTI